VRSNYGPLPANSCGTDELPGDGSDTLTNLRSEVTERRPVCGCDYGLIPHGSHVRHVRRRRGWRPTRTFSFSVSPGDVCCRRGASHCARAGTAGGIHITGCGGRFRMLFARRWWPRAFAPVAAPGTTLVPWEVWTGPEGHRAGFLVG